MRNAMRGTSLIEAMLAIALLAAWCVGRPYKVGPATLVAGAIVLDAGVMIETQPGEGRNDIMGLAFLLAFVAFLINGHMAVSASSRGGLLLRVDPAQTESLLQQPKARPFEMRGREMSGWLHVDGDLSDDELAVWVGRGVAYVKSLPPK